MIVYRDMTFCPFYEDCTKADRCHRPLLPSVRNDAVLFGLPIEQFTEKPTCHSTLCTHEWSPNDTGDSVCLRCGAHTVEEE